MKNYRIGIVVAVVGAFVGSYIFGIMTLQTLFKVIVLLSPFVGAFGFHRQQGLHNDADTDELKIRDRVPNNVELYNPQTGESEVLKKPVPTNFLGFNANGDTTFFDRVYRPLIIDTFNGRPDPTGGNNRMSEADCKEVKRILKWQEGLTKKEEEKKQQWLIVLKKWSDHVQEYFSEEFDARLTVILGLPDYLEREVVELSGVWVWRSGRIYGRWVKGEKFILRHPPEVSEPDFEHEVEPWVFIATYYRSNIDVTMDSIKKPWSSRMPRVPSYLNDALKGIPPEEWKTFEFIKPTGVLRLTEQFLETFPAFSRNMVVRDRLMIGGDLATIALVEAIKTGGVCPGANECPQIQKAYRELETLGAEVNALRRDRASTPSEPRAKGLGGKIKPPAAQVPTIFLVLGISAILGFIGFWAGSTPGFTQYRNYLWGLACALSGGYFLYKWRTG